MNVKTQVNKLWDEMREAINKAYDTAEKAKNDDGRCLKDYVENISWSDDLAGLLGRETANERRHRTNRPSVSGFSNETAAKLILMGNVVEGSNLIHMPKATEFLMFRQTAAEARLIGFLSSACLSFDWRDTVKKLDYSELMKASRA